MQPFSSNGIRLAVVGATGMVGQEMIAVLARLQPFAIQSVTLLASARSAGQTQETPFGPLMIQELTAQSFEDCDIALFAAGSDVSEQYAPIAVQAGAVVIDNSSFYRYNDAVPLIVPEINPEAAQQHTGIIANPNCTTAIAAIPLAVIDRLFGLERVIVSTYQAASGAGTAGVAELEQQLQDYVAGNELTNTAFVHQLLYNVIPHIDAFQDNGFTKEEMKVAWETRKILNRPDLPVSCTAVRIPIARAHSEAITVETREPVNLDQLRTALENQAGVQLVDDIAHNQYPMPLAASGQDDVQVGRVRQSIAFENGLDFFVSGDQILKGAALNAVQIAALVAADMVT